MVALLGKPLSPLTYGQTKANRSVIDALTATGLDLDARIEAAIAFLRVVTPDADFDAATPGELMKAATDLYMATFYRPEDAAPVPQNP